MIVSLDPKPIPRMPATPLLGNLDALRDEWLTFLGRVTDHCGEAGAIRVGPVRAVVLNGPDLAADVLVKNATSFRKEQMFAGLTSGVFGKRLLPLSADSRSVEQVVGSAFEQDRLARYANAMIDAADAAAHRWRPGGLVDIHHEMLRLSTIAIGRALFADDVDPHIDRMAAALDTVRRWIDSRVEHPLSLPLRFGTERNRQAIAARDDLHRLITTIVHARYEDTEDRHDILSMLVLARTRSNEPLPTAEIRDYLVGLLLSGFESVASVLTFAWALLARHADVRAKVVSELRRVFDGAPPDRTTINKLSCTARVLRETMRLYPPRHTIARGARRRVWVGPYRLPAKTVAVISPWLIHRVPTLYPDPERFDPDRFLPLASELRDEFAFMPFGADPAARRSEALTHTQALVALATIGQRAHFELMDDHMPQIVARALVRPKAALARVVRRDV